MIVLDETYRIDADGYQYILYEEGKPDSKGRPAKQSASYHRTLGDALKRYYRLMEARAIRDGTLACLRQSTPYARYTHRWTRCAP